MIDSYIDGILKEETVGLSIIDYHSEANLLSHDIDNGVILPFKGPLNGKTSGGVVESDGTYVDLSGLHENHGCGYPVSPDDIIKKEKIAIYLGMWFPIWGHCITDNIKKLWFLKTEEAQSLIREGADLVYVVMMNEQFELPQSFIDLLLCLDIDISKLKQITVPTRYKHIYIPDNSLYRTGESIYYTKEFVETRNDIVAHISERSEQLYDKVYFSRSCLKQGKQDFGEKRIEDVFKYLGYAILYPEKMTFAEQITVLQNCTHFAATEGSTSHNSMFCKEGTLVTILRKAAYINEYQFLINKMCSLQVTYVDAHLSIFVDKDRVWNGPFFLYVNDNVLRFANIPLVFNNFSIRSFRPYVKAGYARNKTTIELNEFYSSRLLDELNTSYFCKNIVKRIVHYFLSTCNLSLWVPLYKKFVERS